MPRKLSPDKGLFFVTVALVLFGIVMVNSASAVFAGKDAGAFSYFFLRQAAVAMGSLFVMWIVMRIDYQRYNDGRLVSLLLGLCLVMLLVVLLKSRTSNVHRWLRLGPLNFQPSELTKIGVLLFAAGFLSRRERTINHFRRGLLPYLMVVGLFTGLILIEPDLGTAACLLIVTMALLFLGGLEWRYLFASMGMAGAAGVLMVLRNPYQLERIRTFFKGAGPDVLGTGYQIHQSLIAIGSGGVAGLGLGDGKQKFYFLPQPHTDFIFSVVGEELGLVGTTLIAFLFLIFFWRGVKAAVRAPDRFGYFLALGVTLLIVLQSFVNMSVVLHLLPTKGIPLPFISMGGSSILVSLIAAGILLNISQYAGGVDHRITPALPPDLDDLARSSRDD